MSPSPSAAIVADEKPPTLPGLSAGVPHPCSGGGRKRYSSPTCSPSSRSAFRLATLVWELTWSGGAPGLTTASKPTPPAVLAPTTPAAEAEAETPSTPGLVADGAAFLPSTPMPSAELPKTPEPGPLFTPRTPAALAEAAAELIFPSRPNEVSAVESFRATSWPLPFTVPATEVAASTVFVCPRLNTPPIPEPAIAVAASASAVRTAPTKWRRNLRPLRVIILSPSVRRSLHVDSVLTTRDPRLIFQRTRCPPGTPGRGLPPSLRSDRCCATCASRTSS